jgi:cytochrome c oxidase assembly protein subunit 15
MTSTSLYDLSPLVRMMAAGIALAIGPMVWVWFRNRTATPVRRLHALTLITLFLTFDLVLFGAFTRLTDSGLGCPDWPGCYGNASPIGATHDIAAAQSAMPTGPVTRGKAWIEMIHRYLATGVGVLILVTAVASWLAPRRLISPWWATATLVWVCIQGAFGALTVTMKLFPAIVTLHLMGGLVLLALLCVQVVRFQQVAGGTAGSATQISVSGAMRGLLWVTFGVLIVQIALGGWVSTNYAVLACSDFPRCQGNWWPVMDFEHGFELWRHLGFTGQGEHIGFAALTAIHFVHRLFAAVVLLLGAALAWRLNSRAGTRLQSRWLAALLSLQLATGLSNVVFDWPLLAALLHTGGAAALVLVLTWVACTMRSDRVRSPERAGLQRVSGLSA